MLICPAIYYIDIIEVCGWKKERLKNGKLRTELLYLPPPRIGRSPMFSSAFFKIFIVLHPSIRSSNNAALATIREGFSIYLPCTFLYLFSIPLRIRPRPCTGCTRPLVFQYPFRAAAEIEGWNWKKPCINCWTTPDAWTSVVFLVLRYIDRGFGC